MTEPPKKLIVLDDEVEKIILQKMRDFQGVGSTLESALGALVMGQYFGWRILKLLHNPATYRRYEKALGIEFKDVCPEVTDLGKQKSIGYAITEKLGSFWAVIMGRKKVPEKGHFASPEEVERIVSELDHEEKGNEQ